MTADTPTNDSSTAERTAVNRLTPCEICTHQVEAHDFLGCAFAMDRGQPCACRAYRNNKRDLEAVPAPAEQPERTADKDVGDYAERLFFETVEQATTIKTLRDALNGTMDAITYPDEQSADEGKWALPLPVVVQVRAALRGTETP